MTGGFEGRFPNTRRAAARARKELIAHIAGYGFTQQDLSDIETAIGEALANAAEHGHREQSAFDVRVVVDRHMLIVEIEDDGAGFAWTHRRENPGHDAPRGFGIYLMRHLMDEVHYNATGTSVRLAKRLPIARRNEAARA